MNDGVVKVDFELGDEGQINGFDAWRLERFVDENNIKTNLSNGNDIKSAIELAESNGEISFSGYILYYLNKDI